ncbi:hypothetical protein BJ742DRAFT_781091 [Cladochytrium replicatum]|nr:hypothetical protein BJ742DRAFT_781091 [Cladochytrium replicatum]
MTVSTATGSTAAIARQARSSVNRICKLFVTRRHAEAAALCSRTLEHPPLSLYMYLNHRMSGNQEEWGNVISQYSKALETDAAASAVLAASARVVALIWLRIVYESGDAADVQEAGATVQVWDDVVEMFGGIDAIPVDILLAGSLVLTRFGRAREAKDAVEMHLATRSEAYFARVEERALRVDAEAGEYGEYERLVEVYVLHILPRLNDWRSAREFLETNGYLRTDRLKFYLEKLDSLIMNTEENRKEKKKESEKPIETVKDSVVVDRRETTELTTSANALPAEEKAHLPTPGSAPSPRTASQVPTSSATQRPIVPASIRVNGVASSPRRNTITLASLIRSLSGPADPEKKLSLVWAYLRGEMGTWMAGAVAALVSLMVLGRIMSAGGGRRRKGEDLKKVTEAGGGVLAKVVKTVKMGTNVQTL